MVGTRRAIVTHCRGWPTMMTAMTRMTVRSYFQPTIKASSPFFSVWILLPPSCTLSGSWIQEPNTALLEHNDSTQKLETANPKNTTYRSHRTSTTCRVQLSLTTRSLEVTGNTNFSTTQRGSKPVGTTSDNNSNVPELKAEDIISLYGLSEFSSV